MLQIRNTCNLKPHVYCIWRLLVKYGKAERKKGKRRDIEREGEIRKRGRDKRERER